MSSRDGRSHWVHAVRRGRARGRGYILIETLVALTVLSISAFTLQRVIGQAALMQALSHDYTTVQHLMENTIARMLLENMMLEEKTESGAFPAPYDRFAYTVEVSRITVPRPELPSSIDPREREQLESRYRDQIPKLRLEITWTRGGFEYSRAAETLLTGSQLWLPPEQGLPR